MGETENTQRQAWLGLLARAPQGQASGLLEKSGLVEEATWLRRPEVGSVMVQGRAGATGQPFNLGEMTVTRCTLRLGCGTVGHGHVQGRGKADAEAAAMVDALMQTSKADAVDGAVLSPLRAAEDARRAARAEKAAATKVEFFTMVRGED